MAWIRMALMNLLLLHLATQPARAAGPAPPATGFLYKTLTLDGQTYAYCVYVPPGYTPEQAWPVILFLHGSGERGTDGFLQTDIGLARALRRHRQNIPAVVVMPQCRPKQVWIGPMVQMALRCLEATSREYHLDPARVYLTGLSMGGQGAWLIAAEYPGRFAAIVPICGFADLAPSSAALAGRIAARLTATPVWAFHGSADPNVPAEKSRELVAAVRAAGGKAEYTEYPGGTHNVWDRAYDDPALWKWLFAQKLAAPATGEPGQ